jgi:hypothetical protein
MNRLSKYLSHRLLKKDWNILDRSLYDFVWIEVTDPSWLWVNVDHLLIEVIERSFHEYQYLAISQFVDKDQWDIGDQDLFIQTITRDFTLPVVLSKDFGSLENSQINDKTFIFNIIGQPEKDWLEKVIGFGATNNPNILYGLQSIPENWFSRITGWNISFRKWFELISDASVLKELVEQVDLMGWTEDGHLNIGSKDERKRNEILEIISEVAKEKSLNLVIK